MQFKMTSKSLAFMAGDFSKGALRHIALGIVFGRYPNFLFTLTDVPNGLYVQYGLVRRFDGRWNYTRLDSRGALLINPPAA